MSDVGGCLGLYFGMSLLSFVQVFELIVDLIIYFLSQSCAACQQRFKVCSGVQQTPNSNVIQQISWLEI